MRMTDPIPLLSSVANGALAASLLATSLLAACVDSTGPPFPRIEETEFAPALGIDLAEMRRLHGGIYIHDIAAGTGASFAPTQSVEVAYSMYLADGTLVDDREAFRFRIGCRDVIAGMETGVVGMRVGGQRKVIVPGRWGFGPEPPWGIDVPFGAILIYEVEALGSREIPDCDTPA
jgi:hypothetical protein